MIQARRWAAEGGAAIELRPAARWLQGPDGTRVERIEIELGRPPYGDGTWWRAVRPNGRAYSSMWNQRGWTRSLGELAELGVELEALVEVARWVLVVSGPDGTMISRTELGTEPDLAELETALAAVGATEVGLAA
jgi:hypothetical protein